MRRQKPQSKKKVQPLKAPSEFLELRGEVMECLPGATFRVKLENAHEILAYLSGKMRMNRIRLLPGDNVKIEMTPYDVTKGRVVYRY